MNSNNCISICNSKSFFQESLDFLNEKNFEIILIGSGERQTNQISPILLKISKVCNINISTIISRNEITGRNLAITHDAIYLKSLNYLKPKNSSCTIPIISISNSSKMFMLLKIIFFYRKRFKFLICESTLTPNLFGTFIIVFLSRLFNLPILILSDQSFYPEVFSIYNLYKRLKLDKFKLIINLGSELTYHFLSRISNLGLFNRKFINLRCFYEIFKRKKFVIYKDLSLGFKNIDFNPKEYIFKAKNFTLTRKNFTFNNVVYPINYDLNSEHDFTEPDAIINNISFLDKEKVFIWNCPDNYLVKGSSKKSIGLTYSILISLCFEHFKVGYDSKTHFLDQLQSTIVSIKNKISNLI